MTRLKPEPLLSVTEAPDAAVVLAIVPDPPFERYEIVGFVVHSANNMTGLVMVNVSPGEYDVPVPSALVFQPENTLDVFVIDPVLPRTVTVEPDVYGVEPSVGAVPLVVPFPLYAIVGRQLPVSDCRVKNG